MNYCLWLLPLLYHVSQGTLNGFDAKPQSNNGCRLNSQRMESD